MISIKQIYLPLCAVITGSILLISFGVVGLGRSGKGLADFDFYYAAGQTWLEGESTYKPEPYATKLYKINKQNIQTGLGYAPSFVPFVTSIASLPYNIARILVWVTGVLLIFIAIMHSVLNNSIFFLKNNTIQLSPNQTALIIFIILAWPFSAHLVWLGQASLPILISLIIGWDLIFKKQTIIGGLLIGLVIIKPYFAILPFLWLFLLRQWKALLWAGISVLLLSSYAMTTQGFFIFIDWLHAMSQYSEAGEANTLGSKHIVGMASLISHCFESNNDKIFSGLLTWVFIGCFLITLLWKFKHNFPYEYWLPIIMTIQIGIVYGHSGDIFALYICLPLLLNRTTWKKQLLSLLLIIILCVPQRFVDKIGFDLLLHWRTPLVILIGILLCWDAIKSGKSLENPQTANTNNLELCKSL